jgi:hypothetical protein
MPRQTIRSNLSGMRQEILGTVHPNAELNGQPAFSVIVADLKVPPCRLAALPLFTLYKISNVR